MNLSIKARLTLGSLFLYGLMMFSAVLGLYHLIAVDGESKAVLADNYDSVRHLHGMHRELDRPSHERASAIDGIDSLLRHQEGNITESGEEAITTSLRAHFEAWRSDSLTTDGSTLAMRRDVDGLLELNLNAIAAKSALARTNAGHALFWLFLLAVLITVIGLGFSVAFPAVMAAPILRLQEGVEAVAARHYDHRIPPFRMPELDALAGAFNHMAERLGTYEHSNLAQLMQEKNRAEAVINALQDASIGVDLQGQVIFANRPALQLLGLPEPQVVGHPASEVAQRNSLFERLMDADGASPIKATENGRAQYYLSSALPIAGPNGRLGTLYLLRNITLFQERDQAKTNFLATISHELKTPLASSDIGLTLLERQASASLNAEQQAILHDLRMDHRRLVRIVGELLDLAQAETGHITLHLSEPRLHDIVAHAMEAVKATAQQKHIRFDLRTSDREERVHADADKAGWVLVNLLSNAVRHSPVEGIISITAAHERDRTTLTVTDQGPGVPPEQRKRVFERFAPGRSTPAGTGLGLAIAREFMLAMGGSITYDPAVTTGASFTLHFTAAR